MFLGIFATLSKTWLVLRRILSTVSIPHPGLIAMKVFHISSSKASRLHDSEGGSIASSSSLLSQQSMHLHGQRWSIFGSSDGDNRGAGYLKVGQIVYLRLVEICLVALTPVSMGVPFGLRWYYNATFPFPSAWQAPPFAAVLLLFLVPIVIAQFLSHKHRAHMIMKSTNPLVASDAGSAGHGDTSNWIISAYSTMTSPFAEDRKLWLVAMVYRRVLFAILNTFFWNGAARQLTVTMLLLGFLLLHWHFKPFKNDRAQRLESVCLSLLVVQSTLQIPASVLRAVAMSPSMPGEVGAAISWTTAFTVIAPLVAIGVIFVRDKIMCR